MSTPIALSRTAERERPVVSAELGAEIARIVTAALAEDVGSGDATSRAIIPSTTMCVATVVARADGVVAGLELVDSVFETIPGAVSATRLVEDGAHVRAGAALTRLEGPATTILTGERTALNFLSHLSGIATLTRAYVECTSGQKATILDTRKTTPGMRHSEKFAVRCGGGHNHRLGLYDAVLIKDNHLLLSGTLEEAVSRARERTSLEITVEAESLAEVSQALAAGADRILLDNMTVPMLRECVSLVEGRVPLEASGGVTLETVGEIASTGVDFISVGSLTHSAPALDVSLEVTA